MTNTITSVSVHNIGTEDSFAQLRTSEMCKNMDKQESRNVHNSAKPQQVTWLPIVRGAREVHHHKHQHHQSPLQCIAAAKPHINK